MKSLLLLWQVMLSEESMRCRASTTQDYKTVLRRFKDKGEPFLTITLPEYSKDLERALEQRQVTPDLFRGYAKFRGSRLPVFLGGFMELIFDLTSGGLLDRPSSDAIRAVRQLTALFAKLSDECSKARTDAAFNGFIQTEKQVRESDARVSAQQYADFRRVSSLLWRDVFLKVDHDVYEGRIVPKHGPGATAERLQGNAKYLQREWTRRLDKVFPHWEHLIPHYRYLNDIADVSLLEPGAERPVRVIAVPKTQKTPRIIAIEPTCMQYMQQGLMERFVESIECHDKHSWIIGFLDQQPNQLLAQVGSSTGELATLDLSEASDRVSNQLVIEMFARHSQTSLAVQACRSVKADVPGHGVQRLAKFASMGSALTFPMEAIVFSTLIFLGIEKELGQPLTLKTVQQFKGKVRVYGDDIIVPVEYARSVIGELEAFGFKVNTGKSFWHGSFRESCGKDFYDGDDVSIVRVRTRLPASRSNVAEIVSTASLRNQLYKAGLWQSVKFLDEWLENVLIHYPVVHEHSPLLGRHTFLGLPDYRMHRHYQSPIVKGYVVSGRAPVDPLDGYGALMKFFLKRGEEPFADRNHLERYGRPEAVDIKLRYASAQ